MRKTPSTPVDRSSQTFKDATAIIGKGSAPQTAAPVNPLDPTQPDTSSGVHNIDITPADNGGVSVTHRMKKKPSKGDMYDNTTPAKTNVFSTPDEAHAHIGHLLGVKSPHSSGKGGGGLT